MAKVSAEPGDAPELDAQGQPVFNQQTGELQYAPADPRWVGTGRTVLDNKGNPIKQYEPFFSATEEYEDDAVIVEWGVTPLLHYDPLGRLIRTDLPNGSYAKVERDPWSETAYDENDTAKPGQHWYDERIALSSGDPERDAAEKAFAHADTPTLTHLDALGRPVAVDAHNIVDSTSEHHITKSVLDIQGNVLSVVDADSRTCMTYAYDML